MVLEHTEVGMGVDIDHYAVLGLTAGEEGTKLTLDEIKRAYREQSRVRHPDKRPDDPNATADFQRLKTSFEILKDLAARAAFDARKRARRERIIREAAGNVKRRKLVSDLYERERAAADAEANDPVRQAELKDKAAKERLWADIAALRTRMTQTTTATSTAASQRTKDVEENKGSSVDEERTLKVSWEKSMGYYSAARLKEVFEKFGVVVLIRSTKKKSSKGSAIVVMVSKDVAVAASQCMSGSLSNPLLVLPLRATSSNALHVYGGSETIECKFN